MCDAPPPPSHTHTHTHTHTHRSSDERLGDVICRLAPFLKLYSHYTSGFEEAMKTLTECTKRDKKFDTIVRDFEVSFPTGAPYLRLWLREWL